MTTSVEELAASAVKLASSGQVGLRGAVHRVASGDRRLRRLVLALSLGYLRNYKLVEEALRRVKRKPPRSVLARILAYEALFRPQVSLNRLLDIASRRNLPLHRGDLEELRRLTIKDILSGLKGLRRLSVRYSQPLWVVAYFTRILGFADTRKLLEAFNRPHPRWVWVADDSRVAVKLLQEFGVKVRRDPRVPDLLRVVEGDLEKVETRIKAPHMLRDKASVLAAAALGVKRGWCLLDVCSAPGGKAIQLSFEGAYVVGADISERRLVSEAGLASSLGASLDLVHVDSSWGFTRPSSFEAALVDPDCSSMGRLGHSPETRIWLERAGPRIVGRMSDLQKKLLRRALQAVRPGGVVVYTTCTLTVEENEEVISSVVDGGLAVVEEPPILLGRPGIGLRGSIRLYPHLHDTIGAFIARLRKT